MQRKAKFAWASIAGAEPEPVEVITGFAEDAGRTGVLTTGCADPFWLDDESAGVVLYAQPELNRPVNPETEEQKREREEKYEQSVREYRSTHRWRGPR